ncbi:helix-loop-helix DNA-binding domain-containing protein [Chaetomium fimeti]|uniref:Helix-loop-helix DNA-binding domain-containing protein n=1 Tax=Chaetomium fimeti TaxID=1854472 RepID=A0AAE0LM87_9PEZI|nr:helix-loop-helix DNA-binding domain-containing protein [Chaetomium fimeti]
MSGTTTIDSSMAFDPYTTTSFDASDLQTYPDYSPMSFFDTEDFGADFSSGSAASPSSPLSPALSASSFGFPTTDAWTARDSVALSPEPEKLFECQTFASCSPSNPTSSPVINPLDLTVPPFFQSPQIMLATIPNQQQPTTTALPTPPTPSTTPPITNTTTSTKRYPSRGLKRKSASSPCDSEEPAPKSAATSPPSPTTSAANRPSATPTTPTGTPAPKKTAHNMIEKRYRTNLNDKITQLRDAVPSLRILAHQRSPTTTTDATAAAAADVDVDEAATGNGGGGGRLNKATILSKATEYIMQLERRNLGLEAENGALRGRVEGLEMLLMGSVNGGDDGGSAVGESGGVRVVGGWN